MGNDLYSHDLHLNAAQQQALLREGCDPQLLRWATGHLETCEACRQNLEAQAAEPSWWSRAEELQGNSHLSTVSPDGPQFPGGGGDAAHPELGGGNAQVWRELAAIVGPAKHPELLGQLGNYEIERVIGRGGMGIVLRGFDRELHRPVAIKVISPHLAHSGTARKRFEREARAAAAVVHPNVMPIHSVNTSKGHPFIVMPLVAGRSLQAQVDQFGPLDTKDVVRVGIQIAAGLAAAHQQGLIHRDIKPANILIEHDVSRVVITDFGLARAADDLAMTQTGWLAGTPHYMSPEQASGTTIDQRSDLFSLGSVLYFLATGREPFRAEKPMAVLHKICNEPAIPPAQIHPDVPATLSDIIEKLLEKQPNDRFASAARVQRILEEYLTELQQPRSRRHAVRVITRRVRVQRQRMWLAGLAATLIPVGFGLGQWYAARNSGDEIPRGTIRSENMARSENAVPGENNGLGGADAGTALAPFTGELAGNAASFPSPAAVTPAPVAPTAVSPAKIEASPAAVEAWNTLNWELELSNLQNELARLEAELGQDPAQPRAEALRPLWLRWFEPNGFWPQRLPVLPLEIEPRATDSIPHPPATGNSNN